MGKGIFIAGTDTDVGKTFITAGLNYSFCLLYTSRCV